jgi:phosphoribosylaminoimidazolecarboxamide formyltransferase/IMP cyclohydrolase
MRALLAVTDKSGIAHFADELQRYGCEIISTTGTFNLLQLNGVNSKTISQITGSPEMLGGRLKTFHPKIFGGILFVRGNPAHEKDLQEYNIEPIDIVVCNFYSFNPEHFVSIKNLDEIQGFIDIGGPALVRAAAKNFQSVLVLVDPQDYKSLSSVIKECDGDLQQIPQSLRLKLATKALEYTANYDLAIAKYYSSMRK